MELEDLRIVVLDERESGKLTPISRDIFKKGQARLRELYSEAQSIDIFLTDRGSYLMNEIDSLTVTLNDISRERFKKILKMAINQMDTRYVDAQELRKMIPEEREMYDDIYAAIAACRHSLIDGALAERTKPVPTAPPATSPPVPVESVAELSLDKEITPVEAECPEAAGSGYDLVHVFDDIEPFMGTDGRIYSLIKDDLVSLPLRNAQVLYERNIALNIKVSK
ncbi:MAG: DNA replication complex GINS family protein [Methanomicrobiales archaeon]|nr:DNA replication complex GINS family protein [Methanomicrobiales archaeon]